MAKNYEDRKSNKKNSSKAKNELVTENRRLQSLKRAMSNEQRNLKRSERVVEKN